MNPEQERQLKEALELARENNKILRKIKKSMFWSRVFRILYILIIVGAAVGAFYFVQPYIEGILNTYRSILNGAQEVNQSDTLFPTPSEILQSF